MSVFLLKSWNYVIMKPAALKLRQLDVKIQHTDGKTSNTLILYKKKWKMIFKQHCTFTEKNS